MKIIIAAVLDCICDFLCKLFNLPKLSGTELQLQHLAMVLPLDLAKIDVYLTQQNMREASCIPTYLVL